MPLGYSCDLVGIVFFYIWVLYAQYTHTSITSKGIEISTIKNDPFHEQICIHYSLALMSNVKGVCL